MHTTTRLQNYEGYETGPIRPPSEASSLLLRVTRNCSWNRCTFCPGYDKSERFSIRPTEHVLKDIDTIRQCLDLIHSRWESHAGSEALSPLSPVMQELVPSVPNRDAPAFHAALGWYRTGMKSVFLQDGNSLMIKPKEMIRILKHIRNTFPEVERITTFARAATVCRIQDADLKQMADCGLSHVQIGFESGSDRLLTLVDKGSSRRINREAGLKIKSAGIELSVYLLWGLGGEVLSREHALKTAALINQVNPDIMRFVTLSFPEGKELYIHDRHLFQRAGEADVIREIRLFLNALDNVTSFVESDFDSNLLHEIRGQLPDDKETMLSFIDRFLNLPPEKRATFLIGKRTRMFSGLQDLLNRDRYEAMTETCRKNGITPENANNIATQIVNSCLW